jgi:NodT family efflux transporter outer membrane factor (OMF) lipoprotein
MNQTKVATGSFLVALVAGLAVAGCSMIGPDYAEPMAPVAGAWTNDTQAVSEAPRTADWWKGWDDPVLDRLVETAYANNRSLELAGLRVLEARARRGIAFGNLFPQQQEGKGSYSITELSETRANRAQPGLNSDYSDWTLGLDAAWELDLWGRFRRAVESADAELAATVADYDDVLVSLVAETAGAYVRLRVLEDRLEVARRNVTLQQRGYDIAAAKFRNGLVSELDRAEAETLLRETEALIPAVAAGIEQTRASLCVLLGMAPTDLTGMLEGGVGIPAAPAEIALGVPADLLRRRPDVRAAERRLAAQSAQIGVARSDFLPHFALVGSINLGSKDLDDLFKGDSFEGFGGPSFRWAILNYGRIANNVRVQDARYQQLVNAYENSVLVAQAETESALAGFVGARSQIALRTAGVVAATRALELANLQYREGAIDYLRVLNAQSRLLASEDRLVTTRGEAALQLIAVYRALGGGWQLRDGADFVDEATKEQMRGRTRWGSLLEGPAAEGDAAAAGT